MPVITHTECFENKARTDQWRDYKHVFAIGICVVVVGIVTILVATIHGLPYMITHDLVQTNHAFTEWCSKYEDSTFCNFGRNDTHDIVPAPQGLHGSLYQRVESLELGYLKLQEKLSQQNTIISSMEERLQKLEKSHALSDRDAVELALESLQHSSRTMSSRLDSELASTARDLESISERMHRVENHVFVSEDLQQQQHRCSSSS